MKESPAKTLERARIALLLDEPFFGTLLLRLKPVFDAAVKTMSTNGVHLRINPQFMAACSPVELKTVLAHEVMHPGLRHHLRRGARDPQKWNVAADYAANNLLDAYGREAVRQGKANPFSFTGPLQGGLINHSFDDLSAEDIYARLPDPPSGEGEDGRSKMEDGKSQSNPAPSSTPHPPPSSGNQFGDVEDGPGDEAAAKAQEAEWRVAMHQAVQAAKMRGRLPAAFGKLIGELLTPKVRWQDQLRTFLTSCSRDDYSWVKPNRRYSSFRTAPSPLGAAFGNPLRAADSARSGRCILPGLHSPRLGPVVVAVDTSGSVWDKAPEFFSEVKAILDDCRPEKLICCQCDADIAEWRELLPEDDFPKDMQAKGGGGTDFRPVFTRIDAELSEPPAALVYLTDLYGRFPEREPAYPVIWACINDTKAPFGQTLSIE